MFWMVSVRVKVRDREVPLLISRGSDVEVSAKERA